MKITILCTILLAMTFGKSNCYSVSGIATESMPEKTSAKLAPAYNGILVIHQGVAEFRDCETRMKLWIKDETGHLDSCYQHTVAANYDGVYAVLHGNIDLNIEPTNEYAGTFLVTHIHRLEHTNGTSDCWQ